MDESDDSTDFLTVYSVFEKIEKSEAIIWMRVNSTHLLPFFCLIGIIGNSMALILIRTNFWLRRLTSNVYLCTLSICSCLFLTMVLVTWADAIYHLPLYRETEIGCKFFTFLAHFSDFICVWMISWISCDRMVVLYRPGIRRHVCNRKFARRLTIGTIFTSTMLYSWVFLFAGLERVQANTDQVFCGLSNNVTVFGYPVHKHYVVFTIFDTIVCTALPSIIIIVVNSFSIWRYRQCMKIYSSGVLRVRFFRGPSSDENMRYEEETAKKLLLSQSQTNTPTAQSQRSFNNCGKLRSSDLQLSRTLLIVTSTFVLLNVPNYIMRIVQYSLSFDSHFFHFFHYLTFLMYYLHHAVLFYMYIFWSPQMKKQLKPTAVRLLECYCLKNVPEFGHRSTSMQNFNRN
ncbi:unnamed protein product [Auanema sp. JU1783]|nr:unnamed protein product [Auanema sp. JU1783]